MLVLNRALYEKVLIGEEIEVMFLGMNGNQARLGFVAPRSVPVNREEVHRRNKTELNKKF